jgi:hypothetical protein
MLMFSIIFCNKTSAPLKQFSPLTKLLSAVKELNKEFKSEVCPKLTQSFPWLQSVLLIRDVITDPGSEFFPSRIQGRKGGSGSGTWCL